MNGKFKKISILIISIFLLIPITSITSNAAFGEVIESFIIPPESRGISWDGNNIWISEAGRHSKIRKLDENGDIIKSYETPMNYPIGIEWSEKFLWIIGSFNGFRLFKLNPDNLHIIQICPSVGDIRHVTWNGKNVWVQSRWGYLKKIDPESGAELDGIYSSAFKSGIAWDGIYIWQIDELYGIIRAIDIKTKKVEISYENSIFEDADGLCYDGKNLWMIGLVDGWKTLLKLDFMNISIDTIQGGFGLKFGINNSGLTTLANVSWSMRIKGGYWKNTILVNGVMDRINLNESNILEVNKLFGIGEVEIELIIGDISQSFNCFLLGPYIYIL